MAVQTHNETKMTGMPINAFVAEAVILIICIDVVNCICI